MNPYKASSLVITACCSLLLTNAMADTDAQNSAITSTSANQTTIANKAAQPVLRFSLNNSSIYGLYAHSEFANLWSQHDAVAFLLDFGANDVRLGLNWAHAFDAQHRFKLAVQHFAQSIDFDFAAGKDHEFVGQNAIGATYQYLLNQPLIHSLDVSGYYAKAADNNFTAVSMPAPQSNLTNIRDITGATLKGVSTAIDFNLWRGASLASTIHYDDVDFNSQHEPKKHKQGLGLSVDLAQTLSSRLSFKLSASSRALYDSYGAGFEWLAYRMPTSSLTINLTGTHLQSSLLPANHDNIIGVGLAYNWGGAPATVDQTEDNLVDWTVDSPAQLPEVYAMRDQTVVAR